MAGCKLAGAGLAIGFGSCAHVRNGSGWSVGRAVAGFYGDVAAQTAASSLHEERREPCPRLFLFLW